ncbi:hypothetical protein DU40_13600 [Methanosarcina mazei]|uniref:Uncharacterized protein n=1 Tax=Methanosarcina mazei TaxID=2209 RepID=A0A0F8BTI4_METMZ|nr:hypothetical protein [Methanosarcina mazei]KKG05876.1 hypothetical protein DU40_13600 [Methanosarcina mazei]
MRIEQLEKQKVTTDDGYLFILSRIPPEYLETKNEELRKFNIHAMLNLYRKISVKAKKNTPEGCWNIIRSHNMRKFFNSTLKNVGADHDFVEFCMGHRLSDTKMAYYEGDPVKLREIYARYIPYLTIQKDLDITETPDFKRLTEENKDLKALVERLIPPWVAGISERIEERSKKMTEEERSLVKEHKSLKKMVNNLEIPQKVKQEEKV